MEAHARERFGSMRVFHKQAYSSLPYVLEVKYIAMYLGHDFIAYH